MVLPLSLRKGSSSSERHINTNKNGSCLRLNSLLFFVLGLVSCVLGVLFHASFGGGGGGGGGLGSMSSTPTLLALSSTSISTTQTSDNAAASASTASLPTSSLAMTHAMTHLDVPQTWDYYAKTMGTATYGNKADFAALERVFLALSNLGYNHPRTTVLIGGTNEGQSCLNILHICPNITLLGFEIQPQYHQKTTRALQPYPHAKVHNLGWSEQRAEGLTIGGRDEGAGLYHPQGQRGWRAQQGVTATAVRLDEWTTQNNVHQAMYVLIDTEGHEPKVIRGMALELPQNQQRFPIFQYELGGTWAERDKRHGNDEWDQVATARHLEDNGYRLFLLGQNNWLAVASEFFAESPSDGVVKNPAMQDEGFGPFVQGNVLALHTKYAPPDVAAAILHLSVVFEKQQ